MSKYEKIGYWLEMLVFVGLLSGKVTLTTILCLCGFVLTVCIIRKREATSRTYGGLVLYLIGFLKSMYVYYLYLTEIL